MKLDSHYFDSIRISASPKKHETKKSQCSWEGCSKLGEYKAPLGRSAGDGYRLFCLEHVKAYNRSYNYFSGMDETSALNWQQASHVGFRPTWRLGENAALGRNADRLKKMIRSGKTPSGASDGFSPSDLRKRHPQKNELKALEKLGLSRDSTSKQIRARYKELVKKFHPDANGGRRDLEDRFREIVQAYDYLRATGFCET